MGWVGVFLRWDVARIRLEWTSEGFRGWSIKSDGLYFVFNV